MTIKGKLIGIVIGTLLLHFPFGTIIGFVLGHLFDLGYFDAYFPGARGTSSYSRADSKKLFFDTTFAIMGYLAKADGVVSSNAIQTAEHIMAQMQLTGSRRMEAIEHFNLGKSSDFDCDAALTTLKQRYWYQPGLLKTFLEIQVQIAMADGQMSAPTKAALRHVFRTLGVPASIFDQFEQQSRAGYQYSHDQYQQHGSYRRQSHISDAYTLLGITKQATDAEVKKAYRRMMSKHHPDRLMSKGVPPEMIKLATQKTQQIKEAYQEIKQARGMT